MRIDPLAAVMAEGSAAAIRPIDWREFWATDHKAEDWLVEPLLPRRRSVAIYSPAKVGKSLLMLDVAARLATGKRLLLTPPGPPLSVVYFDLEMTAADVAERLEDFGYGPDSDLTNLHYYLLPALPPLDTEEGGLVAVEIARRHRADLVIIDTTSRVLDGEENSADTMRAFYMCSGLPLKADGITVCRLDHAGKDVSRGQRGTSAKADDVDLVWALAVRDGGFQLHATHRRQSWVPEFVDLVRLDEPLRYELAAEASWPSGTLETAKLLDELKAPLEISTRNAQKALKNAGHGARREVVTAAVKWRRRSGIIAGTARDKVSGTTSGNHDEDRFGNHPGNQPEPVLSGIREPGSTRSVEPVPSPTMSSSNFDKAAAFLGRPTQPCPSCGAVAWSRRVGARWLCDNCEPWQTSTSPVGHDERTSDPQRERVPT